MNFEMFMPVIVGLILGALIGWGLAELLNAIPFFAVPRSPVIVAVAGLGGFVGFMNLRS